MISSAPNPFLYSQSYDLGYGYDVEFTLDGTDLAVVWSPSLPDVKTAEQLRQSYREARAKFFTSLGIPAVVVEI